MTERVKVADNRWKTHKLSVILQVHRSHDMVSIQSDTRVSCNIHANQASDRQQLRTRKSTGPNSTGKPNYHRLYREDCETGTGHALSNRHRKEQNYRQCSPAPDYHFAITFIHIALRSLLITSKYQKHSSDVFAGEIALVVSTGCLSNQRPSYMWLGSWVTDGCCTEQ